MGGWVGGWVSERVGGVRRWGGLLVGVGIVLI